MIYGEIKCDVCKKVWKANLPFVEMMEKFDILNHGCYEKSKIITKNDSKEKKKNG